MVIASNLGFPRIGPKRELKKALEAYWAGNATEQELQKVAKDIRLSNWNLQKDNGIEFIPSNEFALYDHMLDMTCMVDAIPSRYNVTGDTLTLEDYFRMARGGEGVSAMEMTKWFDTNYHYLVPEFSANTKFRYFSKKAVEQFKEAKEAGIHTRPVLVGAVTYLLLGKSEDGTDAIVDLLPQLLEVYEEVLNDLEKAGANWVQIDEPFLSLDIDEETKNAYKFAYEKLAENTNVKIFLTSYFNGLNDNTDLALGLPVAAIHLDLVRCPQQLDEVLEKIPATMDLSIGVVDGRNIWKNNFANSLTLIEKAEKALGSDRVMVSPSCSLQHSPVDLGLEEKMDPEIKNWMAYAKQKLAEVSTLVIASNEGKNVLEISETMHKNAQAIASRVTSLKIHKQEVKDRAAAVDASMLERKSPFSVRKDVQTEALGLTLLPSTTIGSFPQTKEVRQKRAAFKRGELSATDYETFLEEVTADTVKRQEELDIDMLVHGEFERNDMVEYFGEQLEGFVFSKFGWVQSYGSRCVKPPVIFGDVSRPTPMTVKWSAYAQSLTDRVMKGMLTGPVTILKWSFVRDDQPLAETCKQIGLAIRDEVEDLEAAGIKSIQIDEPAIREGLPLRKSDWAEYLKWSVDCFKLSAAVVRDETQIHTHMCYSEFNEIMDAIAAMDADVISIEASRSNMDLLKAFADFNYPNDIGPGLYDIHSPRVPSVEEMVVLLRKVLDVLPKEKVWVNPDCGLKTRGWTETMAALKNMVEAGKIVRKEVA